MARLTPEAHLRGGTTMKPKEAKRRLCQRDPTIHKDRVHCANISKGTRPVWRVDIPRTKLNPAEHEHIHVLLYDHRSAVLYHLKVPTTYFSDHEQQLGVRDHKGKSCVPLELTITRDEAMFRNQRPTDSGVEFRQFLHYCFGC